MIYFISQLSDDARIALMQNSIQVDNIYFQNIQFLFALKVFYES